MLLKFDNWILPDELLFLVSSLAQFKLLPKVIKSILKYFQGSELSSNFSNIGAGIGIYLLKKRQN